MPPLLCNRKLGTSVIAMQPKVKHLHGYAHVTVLLCCIATNSHVLRMGSVTNDESSDWLPDLFTKAITAAADYNY
jgi:hypothetical protein